MELNAPDVAWLATRGEYWSPDSLPELRGVASLIFGVGASGVGWLANLAGSDWFAGLAPRAEDIAVAGGVACGEWAMPVAVDTARDLGSATKAFFMSAPLPAAWFASVAIPRGLGVDEQAVTLGLVAALRERTDPEGRNVTVVVTIESADDMFIHNLLDLGAFVVRGAPGAGSGGGERLHHYPSRAAITPRKGRIIGVDLADFLSIWRPGFIGELHILPFIYGEVAKDSKDQLLPDLSVKPRGLNILFHIDLSTPRSPLVEMDRVATGYKDVLMPGKGVWIFTDTDRLNEQVDSIDLLIMQDSLPIKKRKHDC